MEQILILPGDGIGPEVVEQAIRVLRKVMELQKISLSLEWGFIGGASLDRCDFPIDEETLQKARQSRAVLLGAVGGPRWDDLPTDRRPEKALLRIRKELGCFANLRPAKLYGALVASSPLRPEIVSGVDLLVVRELTGGLYFGEPRGIEKREGIERGVNTLVYTTPEIERVARIAFEAARKRRKKVTSVDKANVLETTALWRRVVTEIHQEYRDVSLNHLYVDNCSMQLIQNPKQFDVILTENLFGDILSDEAAMLTGSIGMLPSASLGGEHAIYEPVHGSAPDIAGQGKANPLAALLSLSLLFRYSLKQEGIANVIEKAVETVLNEGYRTADLVRSGEKAVGTEEMGDLVLKRIQSSVV